MRPTPARNPSRSLEVQRIPTFPILPRPPPFVIRCDPATHRDIERPPISHPRRIAPRLGTPHFLNMPTPQPVVSVSPHISAWMQLADHVIGRHPHGLPLIARVATRAEIALISGHVHIPWAHAHLKKPQPAAAKIQKPTATLTPSGDVGTTQGQYIRKALNNNTKLCKSKNPRHARGKENIPITPLPTTRR